MLSIKSILLVRKILVYKKVINIISLLKKQQIYQAYAVPLKI